MLPRRVWHQQYYALEWHPWIRIDGFVHFLTLECYYFYFEFMLHYYITFERVQSQFVAGERANYPEFAGYHLRTIFGGSIGTSVTPTIPPGLQGGPIPIFREAETCKGTAAGRKVCWISTTQG